jgi:hypothetical protein
MNIRNVCCYGIIDTSGSHMSIIFNMKGMAGGEFLPYAI